MELYDENIARLIRRSLLGELSEGEQRELESWLKDLREHGVLFDKIKKEMRVSIESPVFYSLNDDIAWLKFKAAVRERRKRGYIRNILKYAAIIVLPLVVVASFWFLSQEQGASVLESCPPVTITPGGARAMLVSADGKIHELSGMQEQRVIEVEKGVLVKQGGGNLVYDTLSVSAQNVVSAMNTLKIPRGGEFSLTLSDGTNIYLNSATELKYPVLFDEKERKVYLSGEAYFEVVKDAERPFYVVTDDIQIQVYGTEFNVNTHRTGCIQTVLVNGKVGIRKHGTGNEIVMKPGELASFDKNNGQFDVKEVDVRQYVIWKDGYFTFENERLEQIMSTLSLWYNVDVFFQSEAVKELVFTGYMKRYERIDEILNAMTDVVGVKFSINGRTIVVSK